MRLALLLTALGLAACAGDPVPVSRALTDPSNPRAAEVPYVPPPSTPEPASGRDAAAPPQDQHQHSGMPGMPGMP